MTLEHILDAFLSSHGSGPSSMGTLKERVEDWKAEVAAWFGCQRPCCRPTEAVVPSKRRRRSRRRGSFNDATFSQRPLVRHVGECMFEAAGDDPRVLEESRVDLGRSRRQPLIASP